MTARSRRMADARRYALIGLFVVGAAIVAAIGIATFFGGSLGPGKSRALMVFRGTVTGLDVGTPVQFRGIKIGEVRDIRTLYDPNTRQVQFAVIAEFSGTVEFVGEGRERRIGAEGGVWIRDMIDRGLRAQLQTRSFVTGQQMIMLDFAPETPATFAKLEYAEVEIPTMRSASEQLTDTLRDVPVREAVEEARRVLGGIDRLLNDSPDQPAPLPALIGQLTELAQGVSRSAPQMADEIGALAKDARATLSTLDKAVRTIERQVDAGGTALASTAQQVERLSGRLDTTLATAQRAIEQLEKTAARADSAVGRLDHALSEDSPLGAGLAQTLAETGAAARALRGTAESLQRNPQQLIFGRP